MNEAKTVFFLKNHDTRSYGFAGRLCIAGSGNPTPVEAAKQIVNGVPFRLPPLFEMSEAEMFRSFRGVMKTMAVPTRLGFPAVEVFVDGVTTPLSAKDLDGWAADYRARNGFEQPATSDEHIREVERAMNRREDPIERQLRLAKKEERDSLVKSVAEIVMQVMKPAQAPTAPMAPVQGRNDEKPEDAPPAPQRARPRP